MVGPMAERRKARRREAVVNDERILTAALAAIDDVGVDRITTVGVAKAAGLTTGAMYARYEHQHELLVDVWQQRSQVEVSALVEAAVMVRRTRGDDEAVARLLALISSPTTALRVGVELMVVTRRIDELADVVPADLHTMAAGLGVGADAGEWSMVALAVGAVFLSSIPGAPEVDWRTIVRWLAIESEPPATSFEPLPNFRSAITPAVDDPVLEALLRSGEQVIARSGVERATLTRIGRAARLSPTVVYTRYENREELMVEIIRLIYGTLISPEVRTLLYSSPMSMAVGLAAWASPQAQSQRRLTLEVVLASTHQHRLAEIALQTDERARRQAADMLADRYRSRKVAADLLYLGVAICDGIAILLDLGVDLDWVDWGPLAESLVGGALADALSQV